MRKEALFVVLIALVAAVSADVQITSYSVLPSTLKPGVSGSAVITVVNPTSDTLTSVVIYQAGGQFTFTSNRVELGDLGPLGSTVITIPFTINSNATPGVYNLMLNAFWTENSNSLTKTFSIPINVTNPPAFRFSFTPVRQVTPGEHFTMDGQITNNGGSVSKVVLTVDSTSFFLDGISQLSLGDIASGQNVSFQIPFVVSASATPGVQSIPLLATYQDPQGAMYETIIAINPVNVEQSSVGFVVNAQPEKQPVPPGDIVILSVNLTNIGNGDAYSAKISVLTSSQYFTPLGSSDKFFDSIPSGSTENMAFQIGISGTTPAGYYPLNITISYLDANGQAQPQIMKPVGIEVGDVPQLSITPDTSPFPVSSDNLYTLSLQFSNIGNINVRSLAVNVSSEYFDILNSPQGYVGSLNVDDYTSVQYTIYSHKNLTPGSYPIHVTMTFKDAYNAEYTVTKDVLLEVVSPAVAALTEKPVGLSLISELIILIVVLGAAYYVYTRYFKKKAK